MVVVDGVVVTVVVVVAAAGAGLVAAGFAPGFVAAAAAEY